MPIPAPLDVETTTTTKLEMQNTHISETSTETAMADHDHNAWDCSSSSADDHCDEYEHDEYEHDEYEDSYEDCYDHWESALQGPAARSGGGGTKSVYSTRHVRILAARV